MKLSERIRSRRVGSPDESAQKQSTAVQKDYYSIKSIVHKKLIEKLDLTSITDLSQNQLASSIQEALKELTTVENLPLNQNERNMLISDLMNEIMGLGPIEPLVADDAIQDILVNGPSQVYVEKDGVLSLVPVSFRNNDHLMQVIDKIVSRVGRRIDESSPMVDARLPNGSRVNVIIPPLALDEPVLSIRKFNEVPLNMENLLSNRTLVHEISEFLKAAIKTKLNILVSGGTGAGKTTILNIMSGYIPENERIVTIEDSAELRLHQPHVVRLESRPPNIEGKGEVTLTDLVKNSLRMRPDRIILGEVRGAEVMDMLQAMNTGHPGSMSTIHANSPRDALSRMEVMVGMGTSLFSEKGMKRLIASAINIIFQLARLPDGRRRILSVSEITGIEGDTVSLQEIFLFEQKGVDSSGNIYGSFKSTGVVSRFFEYINTHGVNLNSSVFRFEKDIR